MEEGARTDQGGATRRELLAGLAGAAVVAALPGVATVPVAEAAEAASKPLMMPHDFLTASSKLCGLELDRSYIQLGTSIWRTLAALPEGKDYADLCRIALDTPDEELAQKLGKDSPHWEMTRTLVATWYTGMVPAKENTKEDAPASCPDSPLPYGTLSDGAHVITYDEALAWTVCESFTKPSATCGGPFGYWHEPPTGAQPA
ncbi:sugar dehydrogenase complex small subunit [Azospirillum sp. SYSU D00513]|uniref:sugar dehydrogenase complex small subunit n=1 Tax=Azospirillum sp. SYSU D00513 TaxID=2812561 RepID=UPI001A962CA9|nr:sugar dehydrogenase complex small subunit [Azospirillum sp. SYSU D00513]